MITNYHHYQLRTFIPLLIKILRLFKLIYQLLILLLLLQNFCKMIMPPIDQIENNIYLCKVHYDYA